MCVRQAKNLVTDMTAGAGATYPLLQHERMYAVRDQAKCTRNKRVRRITRWVDEQILEADERASKSESAEDEKEERTGRASLWDNEASE